MSCLEIVGMVIGIIACIGGMLFLPILLVNLIDHIIESIRKKKYPEYIACGEVDDETKKDIKHLLCQRLKFYSGQSPHHLLSNIDNYNFIITTKKA